MKLLLRKKRVDAKEFSKDFYDRYVFCKDGDVSNLVGDATMLFAEFTHRQVTEIDDSFAEVPIETLNNELLALRLEMIGTAWTDTSKESAALANMTALH